MLIRVCPCNYCGMNRGDPWVVDFNGSARELAELMAQPPALGFRGSTGGPDGGPFLVATTETLWHIVAEVVERDADGWRLDSPYRP